jgi:RNA 3'-terminal phosphate cyclase (ATP)
LLLPMALAGGGRFRTLEPTLHTRTNIATLSHFLATKFDVAEVEPGVWEIRASS